MKKTLIALLAVMLVLLAGLLVMTIKTAVSFDKTETTGQKVAERVEETEDTVEAYETIETEDENSETEEEVEEEEVDEKADPFTGAWLCDSVAIYIDKNRSRYSVYIMWDTSEYDESIWEYSCKLDSETGALTGKGQKRNETYDEEGEVISGGVEYTDGSASFTLEDNALIWADSKEDVAKGMRFRRDDSDEPSEKAGESADNSED